MHVISEHDSPSGLLLCRCHTYHTVGMLYSNGELGTVSLLYIFQLLPVVDLAGQDSQPEWAHSAAGHPPGPARIHSPDRHLSAAVSCLGSASSQSEAGGRCAGHDLAAPPHHCCSCTLLQGQHLLHHLPACRSACCAVTCQAVPSWAVLFCAVPNRVVPCCAVPSRVVPCRAVLHPAVLCCATLCCAPPCCDVLCQAMLCRITLVQRRQGSSCCA